MIAATTVNYCRCPATTLVDSCEAAGGASADIHA